MASTRGLQVPVRLSLPYIRCLKIMERKEHRYRYSYKFGNERKYRSINRFLQP